MKNNNNNKQGFTLVELAIVIVVIGLIIGGVVKGQELITTAKLNAVITQANGFKSAIASFQEKYGALPGDFASAQAQIPGCGDAAGNCLNGNGNGELNPITAQPNVVPTSEARMAWQHLAYANLVTGVVPGIAADDNEFGKAFPAARIGGGFVLLNTTIGTDSSRLGGLWARLQKAGPAATISANEGDGDLSPGDAAIVDRRMDDGNPLTGYVRAGGNLDTCARADGTYNEAVSSRDCVLYFYML